MTKALIDAELRAFDELVGKGAFDAMERARTLKDGFRGAFALAIRLYRESFAELNVEPLRAELRHLAIERDKLVRHLGKDNYLAIIEFQSQFVAKPQDFQEKKRKAYK